MPALPRPLSLLAIASIVSMTACSGSGSPAPSSPLVSPAPTAQSSASGSSAASSTPTGTTSGTTSPSAGGGDPNLGAVALERVVNGLKSPLFATGSGDGSGRVFVVEQGGVIRIVKDGTLLGTPFLDVSDSISSGGERGLLGLAFEPGYGSAGRQTFFVDDTNPDGDTEITAFTTSTSDPDRADPASRHVVLRIAQPFANHNGGMIAFGSDGMLYIGLGDGGSEGDPMGNGQRLDTLLGKILRIDVTSSAGSYAVPPDNPFVGRQGADPEIWAYGLRNPWRFSFDRATHDLWIGDVGQNAYEEIDVARAGSGKGADYGWNRTEGFHCYQPPSGCDQKGLTQPVAEYGHDLGCAVVGGYVDRAPDAGPLSGVYLFADECSGRVWGLNSAMNGRQEPVQLANTGRAISSFGEADQGTVYATDLRSGELLRVVGQQR